MKYFDFEDYSTPIKDVYNDRIYYQPIPNVKKNIQLFMRKGEVTLVDSFFPFAPEEVDQFFTIGDIQSDFSYLETGDDTVFLNFELIQDPIHDYFIQGQCIRFLTSLANLEDSLGCW